MDKNESRVLSVAEAAKILGISRSLAYAGVMRGEIPSIKIGKRLLVPKAAFEQLLTAGSPVTSASMRFGARGPPEP